MQHHRASCICSKNIHWYSIYPISAAHDTHRTASRLETGKINSLGKGWGLTISHHITVPGMKQRTIGVSPKATLSLMHPCTYGTQVISMDGTRSCFACYLEPGGGRVPLGKGTVCNCVVRSVKRKSTQSGRLTCLFLSSHSLYSLLLFFYKGIASVTNHLLQISAEVSKPVSFHCQLPILQSLSDSAQEASPSRCAR